MKKKLKIGHWYESKFGSWIVYRLGPRGNNGFSSKGEWLDNLFCEEVSKWKLMPLEEVKIHLLDYANANYPKGTRYNSIGSPMRISSYYSEIQGDFKIYPIDKEDSHSSPNQFHITDGHGGAVYFNGMWAPKEGEDTTEYQKSIDKYSALILNLKKESAFDELIESEVCNNDIINLTDFLKEVPKFFA